MESTRKNINRVRALTMIAQRRYEQLEKWGEQEHTWSEWATILGEEYGELCEAINETVLNNATKPELGGSENMVNEVVDVAAVALQMLEYLLDECDVRMPDKLENAVLKGFIGKGKKNGNK